MQSLSLLFFSGSLTTRIVFYKGLDPGMILFFFSFPRAGVVTHWRRASVAFSGSLTTRIVFYKGLDRGMIWFFSNG